MKLKDYTILLVPDHTSKVHRYRLSSLGIKLILGGAGLFLCLFVFLTISFFRNLGQGRELGLLKIENQDLRIQFKSLVQQINSMQSQLNRVNELDHRIRIALGLEQNQNSELGVGGPEGERPAMSHLLPPEEAHRIKEIAQKLSQVNNNLAIQELSLEDLDAYLEDNDALILATPSIWPVRGWVTSEFGMRVSPIHGGQAIHQGIDIATSAGSLIRAPASGVVIYAGWDQGYGNLVVLNHGYGLLTKFAHCAQIMVRENQMVKRGQVIATVGATGRATGPHLHYEVLLNGVPVNPRRYILE